MVSEHDVHAAVRSLRLIFWGGLLWILDFKLNGFDVFNDVLATAMIALAVTRLARVEVSPRYRTAMTFVQVVAYLSVITAALKLVGANLGPIYTLVSLAQLAATIVFALAMRWFCLEGGLPQSAASWRLTMILFAAIYAVPLGFVFIAGLIAQLTGSRFNYNLGAAVLLLLIVFFVPIVHLFISTSRMRKEAAAGGRGYPGQGFEVLPPREEQTP